MSWTNSLSAIGVSGVHSRVAVITRTVDTPIAVLVSLADHLVNLIVSQLLADRGHDVAKLGRRDEAVVITVEDLCRNS